MSEPQVVERGVQVVVFELAEESFAIDIFRVQEILRNRDTTPVPKAPPYVRGLINLRGQAIPIMDLRLRLGLGPTIPTDATRIVIVSGNHGSVGLLVDAVTEVLALPPSAVEQPPRMLGEGGPTHVIGLGRKDDRLIALLDVEKVLEPEASS